MTPRTVARVAWFAWALIAGAALLLRARGGGGFPGAWAPALTLGAFMTVGTVVISRQPRNAVGWLCCAAGLLGGLTGLSSEYARYALGPRGPLPGGLAMAWLNSWLGIFWTGLVLTFLLLLFPTGRLPSRRWRPVAWACPVFLGAGCLVSAVLPGPMQVPGRPDNPLGIGSAEAVLRPARALVFLGFMLVALLCAFSVVVRFRRARGAERQQLKWFAYGAGQLAVLTAVALLLPDAWDRWVPLGLSDLIFAVSPALIPVTIAIAILRYRLYEIDPLIRRTLVYGVLTALLGAVYAVLVLSLGQLFGRIGAQTPSWAVASATLAVAALFQPARRRVQEGVDRRFNRSRYDAARTIQAFSVRLRQQTDLDTLATELRQVVHRTVDPTTASLWLRPSTRRPAG